jgi:hypothetical protein
MPSTMGMRDEDLLNLAHLYIAFLNLVLSCLPTIEQPDSTSQTQG